MKKLLLLFAVLLTAMQNADNLQCVVSNVDLQGVATVPFGQSQHPAIDDFADGVDTIQFLKNLNR